MTIFFSSLLAYFIGTIPTAYVFVRRVTGKDIFTEGSGNPGALNTFEVTGDRRIGLLVMLLDTLKGVAAVLVARAITGDNFYAVSMAAVFVVLGHCYNIFFAGRGGRGLAPAAGAVAAVNPVALFLWLLLWVTGYYVIRRHVHVGNLAATIGTPMLLYSTPEPIIRYLALVPAFSSDQYKLMVFLVCLQIFFRHLEPIREMFAQDKDDPE